MLGCEIMDQENIKRQIDILVNSYYAQYSSLQTESIESIKERAYSLVLNSHCSMHDLKDKLLESVTPKKINLNLNSNNIEVLDDDFLDIGDTPTLDNTNSFSIESTQSSLVLDDNDFLDDSSQSELIVPETAHSITGSVGFLTLVLVALVLLSVVLLCLIIITLAK